MHLNGNPGEFDAELHGSQRMNFNQFEDAPAFPLVST